VVAVEAEIGAGVHAIAAERGKKIHSKDRGAKPFVKRRGPTADQGENSKRPKNTRSALLVKKHPFTWNWVSLGNLNLTQNLKTTVLTCQKKKGGAFLIGKPVRRRQRGEGDVRGPQARKKRVCTIDGEKRRGSSQGRGQALTGTGGRGLYQGKTLL